MPALPDTFQSRALAWLRPDLHRDAHAVPRRFDQAYRASGWMPCNHHRQV